MPYIDGGMNTVVKWVKRAGNSAVSGINIKVVAAKDRVLNAIKDMNGVDGSGRSRFDIFVLNKTLGSKLDNILRQLKALIILVIPPEETYTLTEYQTNLRLESYPEDYLKSIREQTADLWQIVFSHQSAKLDAAWNETLVATYNRFVDLYVRGHSLPAMPAATAFVPLALYRPVLLRLP